MEPHRLREVFALGVLLVEVLVQAQGAWRTHMERAKARPLPAQPHASWTERTA